MRVTLSFLFALLLHLWIGVDVFATTKISLLTSSPSSSQVYTLWGHTAIRVQSEGVDKVYNYGVFEFGDGFLYKFVKGETDYWLEAEPMSMAYVEAVYKNVYLYEQKLNLTETEANKIFLALMENEKESNRYYRYNFFYDNCATRPRDLIEKTLGHLEYPTLNNQLTYRDLTRTLTKNNPWLSFGIDLCLGSETDEVVSDYGLMFLPQYLMQTYQQTSRIKDGLSIPLIQSQQIVYTPKQDDTDSSPSVFTPMSCFVGLLLLTLMYTIYQWYKGNCNRMYDYILFSVYGMVGVLVFFLVFVSVHPCTNPNFNLFWTNPLQLLLPFLCCAPTLKRFLTPALWINFGSCMILCLGIFFLPQTFDLAVIPLTLTLMIRTLFLLHLNGKIKIFSLSK